MAFSYDSLETWKLAVIWEQQSGLQLIATIITACRIVQECSGFYSRIFICLLVLLWMTLVWANQVLNNANVAAEMEWIEVQSSIKRNLGS